MAEKQFGIAVVWGTSTTGYTKAGFAIKLGTEEQTYRKAADQDETRTSAGEYANVTLYGGTEELTLRVYPTDTTIALAKTANLLPGIGDEMKVIDAEDLDIGAAATGKSYMVAECGKTRSPAAKVTFDVTLRRFAGITSYTPVT